MSPTKFRQLYFAPLSFFWCSVYYKHCTLPFGINTVYKAIDNLMRVITMTFAGYHPYKVSFCIIYLKRDNNIISCSASSCVFLTKGSSAPGRTPNEVKWGEWTIIWGTFREKWECKRGKGKQLVNYVGCLTESDLAFKDPGWSQSKSIMWQYILALKAVWWAFWQPQQNRPPRSCLMLFFFFSCVSKTKKIKLGRKPIWRVQSNLVASQHCFCLLITKK